MRKLLLLALVAVLSSCNCGGGEPMTLAINGFRGLWTSAGTAAMQPGHLAVADNVMFYRRGVVEPMRGFSALAADLGTAPNAIVEYEGTLIAHHGTASISRWTGSAWSAYSGTFTPPTGGRARFWEAEGSLFTTTTLGVYELDSPTGTWRLTGAPRGLQGTATLRRTSDETGVFTADGRWAYRVTFAYTNGNNRFQEGAPSGRFLLTSPAEVQAQAANISKTAGSATVTVINTTHGYATGEYVDVTLGGAETNFVAGRFQVTVVSATSFTYNDGGSSVFTGNPANDITYSFASRNADIAIPLPSGITTSHVARVWRSVKSAGANSEPSDAMAQVYERAPTNLEVAAGTMTIKDISADTERGAELYTSLEGLTAAKDQPPVCLDAALFKESVFCANTRLVQALDLQVLAVGGSNGLTTGTMSFVDSPDDVSSFSWSVNITASASVETPASGIFLLYTSGSAAQNIADTTKSLVRAINGKTTNTNLYAEYTSTDTEAPGRFRVYGRTPAIAAFTLLDGGTRGSAMAPAVPEQRLVSTLARTSNVVTATTSSAHGYAVGQQVELAFSDDTVDFPNGVKTVASTPTSTTFTYAETGADVPAEANLGAFYNPPPGVLRSTNDARLNGISWAVPFEPWAVPLINFTQAGAGTCLRILPGRDRLMVYTDTGTFQIVGTYPAYGIQPFDDTLILSASETLVPADGRHYGLFDSGFMEVGDSARAIDEGINRDVLTLLASSLSAVNTYGFGVSYDQAAYVLFFLPDSSDDTDAKFAYAYRVDSGDWTRWTNTTGIKHGIVAPSDNKIRLALTTGATWVERKGFAATDQQLPDASGIAAIVQSVPYDGGRQRLKEFGQEGWLDFLVANFASGGLAFSTNLSPTFSAAMTMAPPGGASTGPKMIGFWVPNGWTEGNTLAFKWTHSTAQETWALQGISVEAQVMR